MAHRRARTAFFAFSTVIVFTLGPLQAAGRGPIRGVGTSATSVELAHVELSNVPNLGSIEVSLGELVGDATTEGDSAASIALVTALGTHEVATSDGSDARDVTVPLDGPGVAGQITIAKLLAEADDVSAHALLQALDADASLGPIDFGASLGDNGIDASATMERAGSRSGVTLGPIGIGLGDLLPAELLEALPLSVLSDLANGLNLDLGNTLDAHLATLNELIGKLDEVQTTIAELEDATTELDALVGGNEELLAQIEAAQTQVSDAEAAVAGAQSQLDALQADRAELQEQRDEVAAQLAACQDVCEPVASQLQAIDAQLATIDGQIASAQSAVAAAQSELATAEGTLATLLGAIDEDVLNAAQALVDELQARLTSLIATVRGLLDQLPDLNALYSDVLEALKGAPLLDIGSLSMVVESAADGTKGTASADCGATGVEILGRRVGALTCTEVSRTLRDAAGQIMGTLRSLPVAGNSVPQVSVSGLDARTHATEQPDANGITSSSAAVTALRLGIPSLALEDMVDRLVSDAIAEVSGAIATLPVGDALTPVLQDLQAQLEALPTGDALNGLRTIGLAARVGGIGTTSSFAAALPQSPTPDAPDPQQRPKTAPQAEPQGAPMPFTGAPLSLAGALALWLTVLGLMLAFFGDHKVIMRVVSKDGGVRS